ncbi:30S ribosomal protein S12 methylthiotransferase RimO [Candidatus Zixiibacteriota bacterium]
MPTTFSIISLGCPKNLVDAERLVAALKEAGYRFELEPELAELILVNTCGFIEAARQESLQAISDMAKFKQTGSCRGLVVTGCLSQRYPQSLWEQIPAVDAFLGIGGQDDIVAACDQVLDNSKDRPCLVHDPDTLVEETIPRQQLTVGHSAYLKIADGCDNRCAYCAIPIIRGKHRSRKLEILEQEAREMAARGVRELNLIAQDTTMYGTDLYSESRLTELLDRLCEIEDLRWIRLLYTHPGHYTDRLIETVARQKKICKYLDLPLQHICDDLLKAMNRHVTRQEIIDLIDKLRAGIPRLALRTTLIVGLPGETEAHFRELLSFVQKTHFERLGAFSYSPEEGTPAAEMPQRARQGVADRRLDQLLRLQSRISLEHNRSMTGEELNVLVDASLPGETWDYMGRTQAEAPDIDGLIYLRGKDLEPGDFVRAQVVGYSEYDLFAEVVGKQ